MKLHERLKAIMECKLDSTARMVLVVIADAMSTDDADRPVWRSAATIAERAGISRATAIDTLKRLEAAGVVTSDERTNGDSVRRRIDWRALAAAERPATKRGSNPTARNGGVRTSDRSEDLTPLSEDLTGGESEHLTPGGSEHLTGESEDLTGGVRRPDPIRPTPLKDPPIDDPSTAKNARPMPAAVDLSAVPEALHDGMRRLLAEIATRQTPPRAADAVHRWLGVDRLRADKLFQLWRQMPQTTEVNHAREVPQPPPTNGPSPQASRAEASPAVPAGSPRPVAAGQHLRARDGAASESRAPALPADTGVDHANVTKPPETNQPRPQAGRAEARPGAAPPRMADLGELHDPLHGAHPAGAAAAPQAVAASATPLPPGSDAPDPASGRAARGTDAARGDAAGLVADPDILPRVAAPRWDESPAWHEAAGLYVDISAALLPEARPAYVVPSSPAGRDIGRGLETLGGRYVRRLAAILAALRRELAPAAAHEVARLARDLWAQESPAGALATIRRPEPAPTVAAVDAAIAEDAPWVEPPVRPAKGRDSYVDDFDRQLREAGRRVMHAK